MQNNIKVNLECWLASQFKTILTKQNNPLILDLYTTYLAVNLGVLDLFDHDLHVTCQMDPLDEVCLEKIGSMESVKNIY